MSENLPLIHRDISWLDFNYRVLQESKDIRVPLLERIKFLAIYSSNLDEYFRVRVANLRNYVRLNKKTKKEFGFEPEMVLTEVLRIVTEQQEEFSKIFRKLIIPELNQNGIRILKRKELNEEQKVFIENYFKDNLMPFVQPVLLVGKKIKPFLSNAALYLTLHMVDKDESVPGRSYAMVKIPSDLTDRFIELPEGKPKHKDIIILDDIIRHNVRAIFPGYEILDTYSIKISRDAELYIDDEFSGDLIQKIRKSLSKRDVGPTSRMIYDRSIYKKLLKYLIEVFEIESFDLIAEGRYHNNSDFFQFPSFGMDHLKYIPQPPLKIKTLERVMNIFEPIEEFDRMVHVPYHSYESVIKFFEDASKDPDVTHIKIVQYRVAKKSRIMDALMQAVKNGKKVMVFVEVKARFDEKANLDWGDKLSKAGVKVYYSIPGLKVHSKIALVRKKQNGKFTNYCYLSTGNFHEDTAKVYSDIGIFTADKRITAEVSRVFRFLETKKEPKSKFKHLLVGHFNLLDELRELIKHEIEQARKGKKAKIILKLNSLEEEEMIALLYEADQAGVEIHLIIRGICCLVPGIEGMSDNMEVISIVDRYLEHARLFYFYNSGKEKLYLSSADWMNRNLHRRVEVTFPIYSDRIKKMIMDILKIQLDDNVKARFIDQKKNNSYKITTKKKKIQTQRDTYQYFKRILEN